MEAAEAVYNSQASLERDVLDGLQSLLDKSLLRQDAGASGEPRFRMLETIREYAMERLVAGGEEDAVRRKHTQFFVDVVEEAEPHLEVGPGQATSFGRLAAELDNVRAALEWTLARGPG